ncbi:hypothetical protein, partial [Acinetobacter baumannii]|uniref:hypothetical protein n=1 Tax=Acinetobacter baumannii TaxID=470 RepID=UPI001C06F06F
RRSKNTKTGGHKGRQWGPWFGKHKSKENWTTILEGRTNTSNSATSHLGAASGRYVLPSIWSQPGNGILKPFP